MVKVASISYLLYSEIYLIVDVFESCKKFLNNPAPMSYLGNEELAQKKSEYAFKILEIKQKLKLN